MKLPERELLLDPILYKQGLMMIHAPRGIGKTYFALNLAYAVATGKPFLRYSVPTPHSVLYVDGEMPASELRKRLVAIAGDTVSGIPFRLLTPDLNVETGIPDLSTARGQEILDELIADDTQLIILDNLSCLCRSGNENEAESWSMVQEWALRHRAKGRSIIFIHHSGKSGQQQGTSRREDVLDTVLSLRRPSDYVPSDGARFEVHVEKGRTMVGADADAFEACLVSDKDGGQSWKVTNLSDGRHDEILQLVQQGKSDAEIANILSIDRSTAHRHRKAAKHKGII